MRPLNTPPRPQQTTSSNPYPNQHLSQSKPSGYMLSPPEGNYTKEKKEHMKEAQSPKNVESGEILYRCDPRTGH